MTDTENAENERLVKAFQPGHNDEELLGICKVTHNGREPPKRTPGAHVPLGVLDELGVEIGDRIVWEKSSDGIVFYPVSDEEWRSLDPENDR